MTEPQSRTCLNCETPLQGSYCHACGQKDQARRLPLKALLHDVLHDLWHLDHKVLETLWLLVRRPGYLAEEYLAGRRVRHVPPFRLYVITSFVLFLAFSAVKVGTGHRPTGAAAAMQVADSPAPAGSQASGPEEEAPAWARVLEARAKLAQKDPAGVQRAFLSHLSKSLFVLMPVFAGLLMLLHLRQRESLFVEHLVVALHHHALCFLAVLLLMGLGALPGRGWGCLPGTLIFLAPPLHLAATLQRLYRRGWPRSLAKAALASAAYGLILTAAVLTLLWLSLPPA